MKMVSISDDGSRIELLCNLKDGVTVRHVITVREDEIDFRLGGLKPGEKLEIKGKVYLVNNDLETLRARYRKDFPEHLSLHRR